MNYWCCEMRGKCGRRLRTDGDLFQEVIPITWWIPQPRIEVCRVSSKWFLGCDTCHHSWLHAWLLSWRCRIPSEDRKFGKDAPPTPLSTRWRRLDRWSAEASGGSLQGPFANIGWWRISWSPSLASGRTLKGFRRVVGPVFLFDYLYTFNSFLMCLPFMYISIVNILHYFFCYIFLFHLVISRSGILSAGEITGRPNNPSAKSSIGVCMVTYVRIYIKHASRLVNS